MVLGCFTASGAGGIGGFRAKCVTQVQKTRFKAKVFGLSAGQ